MAVTINGTTGFTFPDGSLATPSIAHTGDGNCGIYFPSADTIGFVTSGVEAARITSSGNIGIGNGNQSPAYILDVRAAGDNAVYFATTGTNNSMSAFLVSGNGTTSGKYAYFRFLNNDTNAQEYRLGTYGDNNFTIYDAKASSARVTITTGGAVGIGVTSVPTNFRIATLGTTGSNSLAAASGTTQSSSAVMRLQAGGGFTGTLDIGQGGGSGSWLQSCDTTNLATNYPLFLNPNGGNVGIRTTSATYALTVGGQTLIQTASQDQLTVSSNSAANGASIRIASGNGTSTPFYSYIDYVNYSSSQYAWAVGTFGGNNFTFYDRNASSHRVTIDTSGNILVGTTTTGGAKICVKNTPTSQWGIDFNECEVAIANGANAALPTGSGMVILTDPTQSGATGVYILGAASVVRVDATGTFVAPTTSPGAGTASIQFASGAYRIYNNIGTTITFKVAMLKTRNEN